MLTHDPVRFLAGINSRLAARSRHVCVLLGAGASKACGLPDLAQLEQQVLSRLSAEQRPSFQVQLEGRTLEAALSRVRKIKALLGEGQQLEGLSSVSAGALDKAVCSAIVESLVNATPDREPMTNFAAWARRTDYLRPLEIFSVNYDLLVEQAFDDGSVLFFDGFSGSLAARFHTALVEADYLQEADVVPSFFVRLWKLHGSVNWKLNAEGRVVRVGAPVGSDSVAAIYPSDLKYDESRRVPFVVLQDRFRRALLQPETLLLVTGYSFSDEHLDELIFDSAMRRQRSEVIVFWFGELPERLIERAVRSPNFQLVGKSQAVLGGKLATWKTPEGQSSQYFGGSELFLPDFTCLAHYLSRSVGYSDTVGATGSLLPEGAGAT